MTEATYEDLKFGTDGVRGVANGDLSAYFTFRLGRAAGLLIGRATTRPHLLLGRDPRLSGDLLGCSLSAGLLSTGVSLTDLGVIPTPGVAYLTRRAGADAGAVISASHNPAPDNGIKFFGSDGRKISDELETEMEESLPRALHSSSPTGQSVGRLHRGDLLREEYRRFLVGACPTRLDGLRVVVDSGNGAASELGPSVLRELGATVYALHCDPDGWNINQGCGALHPEDAQRAVRQESCDLAVSFDGDADRAILADEQGRLVDGDRILAMCALAWRDSERLPGNAVVGTVMSNVGLERGLAGHGIRFVRAPVGDRFVADRMRSEGAAVGGEKSGHILFSQLHTTGDGILTLLQVAALMVQSGRRLSELADQIQEYPQLLVNVPVRRRRGWRDQPELWSAVRAGEARLGKEGRVLVRASGTERIIRVMAEGPSEAEVAEIVHEIAGVVHRTMGLPPTGADAKGE